MVEPQYHWYSFAFQYSNATQTGIGNTYCGLDEKNIRLVDITHAKAQVVAQVGVADAVLVAATYLGYMSRREFLADSARADSAMSN